MTYVKTLGLATVLAAALMAFVGVGTASASAGVLCSTTANPCPAAQRWTTPTTFHETLNESAKQTTTGGFITASTCTRVTQHGQLVLNAANGQAVVAITSTIRGTAGTPCTKSSTTLSPGGIKVENIAGTSNGTAIVTEEIKVTVQGLFSGENCVYGVAAGTSYGTITEGNPASFDLNAVATKFAESDPCPSGPATTNWTGRFTLEEPAGTTLSVSTG